MRKSQISPKFLSLINKFENDLELLKETCYQTSQEELNCFDSTGINEFQQKQLLAEELNKVISYTMSISFITYCKFKKRCQDEGYSVQEGFNRLLESYVNNKIQIKED